MIPGVRRAIFRIFPEKKSEKWPARQPAAGTRPGSRAGPREEGAGATDEREVAPAAWGGEGGAGPVAG